MVGRMVELSRTQREEVNEFVTSSVTEGTRRTYRREWETWVSFIESKEVGGKGADPFMRDIASDLAKSYWLCLFILRRYQAGLRGSEATRVTAAIRHMFLSGGHETRFLGADGARNELITAAKRACRLSPAELRSLKWDRRSSVKLPVNLDLMIAMRNRLWKDQVWDKKGAEKMMTYIGSMWGMEILARKSEYTLHERGCADHCVRAREVSFLLGAPISVEGSLVSSISGGNPLLWEVRGVDVEACMINTSSHKSGSLQKTKVVGRRHAGETEFLLDLLRWFQMSKVKPEDELFTRYLVIREGQQATRKVLTGAMVRAAIKDEAGMAGLPREFYSTHSLRKAGRTQMSAAGCSTEEMNDRGNYSSGSTVGHTVYDYSAHGHGPLSSVSLGGSRVTTDQIRLYVPAESSRSKR